MTITGLVIVGIVLVVGLVGVVLPVLPGVLLCWAAIAVWAGFTATPAAWVVLAVATVLAVLGQVLKYLVPGARMRTAGVPYGTLALGGLLGIVGFFVIPVVGLVIGFVAGIYIAELGRLHGHGQAWPSTVEAVKAVGLAILIELAAGLFMTGAWLGAVIAG